MNISVDSNSNSNPIEIVTRFLHINVVVFRLLFGFGFLTFGHSQGGNLTNLMLITAF